MNEEKCWFVMRDLKRANSIRPAYKMLREEGFEVFTPMKWIISVRKGVRVREQVPFIQDLLFVYSTKDRLDAIVGKTRTLQYRYVRGGYCCPMTVNEWEMQCFIRAVSSSASPRYYLPEELSASMYGKKIRLVGGALDGYEGHLLSVRGSRTKRLLVELPQFFAVGVEIDSDFVELM